VTDLKNQTENLKLLITSAEVELAARKTSANSL
jgi:hypothetical protein